MKKPPKVAAVIDPESAGARTARNQVAWLISAAHRNPTTQRLLSRDRLESIAAQLIDAVAAPAVDEPCEDSRFSEFQMDELARRAGTSTRNVRLYRARGLLAEPRRSGRRALFNETHVARLKLILSLLERGYTLAHVDEMLTAWEEGRDLADILGVESALVGTSWNPETPETMPTSDAIALVGDREALDRLIDRQLVEVRDAESVTVRRPDLVRGFRTAMGFGIDIDTLLRLYDDCQVHIEGLAELLVRAGAEHVKANIDVDSLRRGDLDVPGLSAMFVEFRSTAMATTMAGLADAVDRAIKTVLADQLDSYFRGTAERRSS